MNLQQPFFRLSVLVFIFIFSFSNSVVYSNVSSTTITPSSFVNSNSRRSELRNALDQPDNLPSIPELRGVRGKRLERPHEKKKPLTLGHRMGPPFVFNGLEYTRAEPFANEDQNRKESKRSDLRTDQNVANSNVSKSSDDIVKQTVLAGQRFREILKQLIETAVNGGSSEADLGKIVNLSLAADEDANISAKMTFILGTEASNPQAFKMLLALAEMPDVSKRFSTRMVAEPTREFPFWTEDYGNMLWFYFSLAIDESIYIVYVPGFLALFF